jgi:membrane-bound lytic murein transglycosylase D
VTVPPITPASTRQRAVGGRLLLCALLPTLLLCAGCPTQSAAPPAQAQAPTLTAPAPQQPAITFNAQALAAQRNQRLIDQVERSYQSGVANYRANRLDAARQDFDYSVDLMLTSGLDLRGDPQLSDEFEHIVDAVNSLEMDALKQGNGFSPKVEASPLEEAGNVTFPSNPQLEEKLKAELAVTHSDFPLVINDYVAGFISFFSNSQAGHAHLVRSLERAGRYRAMIQKILAEEGVPQDLIYQAVAESGFQPQALNKSSGAGGMWQFMPTGAYGLARNGWFDERFDPEKSSRAYARYIKGLYNQFGDWYLAMAAYDWGPGNVQRAVQRTGYADFWQLYRLNALPQETKNYVPGILAAIIMAKNPAQYGLQDVVPEAPVVSDTVTVDYALDLRLAADVTGSTVQEIVALNPALLRLSTPNDISYDLHVPAGTGPLFEQRIASVPEPKRTSWRFHQVKAGESMDRIADSFHVTAHDIAVVNDLKPEADLQAGDELLIPVVPAAAPTSGVHAARYTVRRGDTLITVADRFGVTVEHLRTWNHLRTNAVPVGKSLAVAEPLHLAPSVHSRRTTGRAAASSRTAGHTPVSARAAAAHSVRVTAGAKSKSTAKPITKAATKSSSKPSAKPASKPPAKSSAKPAVATAKKSAPASAKSPAVTPAHPKNKSH